MWKKLNLKTNLIWSTNITKTGIKNEYIFICIINMYNILIEIFLQIRKTQQND